VSFFEDLPSRQEQPEYEGPDLPPPEWQGPPRDVMGAVVPVAEAVVHTDHVFVGVAAVTTYPTGLSLDVVAAARRGELSRDRWEGLEASFWADLHRARRRPPGAFRVGIELADGRRTATLDLFRWRSDTQPGPPVLVPRGRGSSGRPGAMEKRLELWLWPLPDGEALSLVLQWPDLDVPLTSYSIDLGPVRAAVELALPYWS
jgi:hypothetical protein